MECSRRVSRVSKSANAFSVWNPQPHVVGHTPFSARIVCDDAEGKFLFASFFSLHRCRALVKDLKDQKSSGRDQQYTLMAMDVLGKVAGGLADITR